MSCSYDQQYFVQPGDTLYLLAQRYNISVIGIEQANPDIDSTNLLVGQRICLPLPPCENGLQYIVKPNDTLYHIAQMYNVSPETILNKNPAVNLYQLQIGQAICIPPSIDVECPMDRFHIVRPGETLGELAIRFNIPLESLLAVNHHIDNPNQMIVGTKLCVPSPMVTPPVVDFYYD
ncbi:LysM peptidoglycan-binding domain-containing protein [Alkalihalobacillus sp. MEB130]|uniref:LysM peptidoglycan-binding domain-containing protein n=1 Tax=Alkalihalobacillus sp. MEB130 TaxID=2976704 RepID=UPI0028DE1D75|nr:LysM peptidoglycan-binding domain-containing protein [Alkalihalobacillus sp. MEB130]MDT8859686.1 LysM peptidoglycan-binding domain-containing protein [Alkalihalobacillus sp. MEB130]